MSAHPTEAEPTVKTHGDKLADATGEHRRPQEPLPIAESPPPLKREGDKLSSAVDAALAH